jgi:hypothetical protein
VVFKSEKGAYTMKLDAVPTRRNEQGELWLNLFVPQARQEKTDKPVQQGFREVEHETIKAVAKQAGPDGFESEDIPF